MENRVKNRSGELIGGKNRQDRVLGFLYGGFPGRLLLFPLTRRGFSKAAGAFMNSRFSKPLIKRAVRSGNINLDDYEETEYNCFNDFFTRKIKDGKRQFDPDPEILCSPCDSNLTVYKIAEDSVFKIKNSFYRVDDLLGGETGLASVFTGGHCLIFRLTADNYHRYCFFDNGKHGKSVYIKGVLHTVNPISLGSANIYARNCREYTVLETDSFGLAVQVEIGAMLVGRIKNREGTENFIKGGEKGMFLFGGSTVALLLREGAAEIDPDIIENSKNNTETEVLQGQKIGRKLLPSQ